MTSTVNGIGTHLCGVRLLKKEEADSWAENFPYMPNRSIYDYYIGTEAFVFFFIPIMPLKTYVFYYIKSQEGAWQVIYYPPSGKEDIYWEHVKTSLSFYIFPVILISWIIWAIISNIDILLIKP